MTTRKYKHGLLSLWLMSLPLFAARGEPAPDEHLGSEWVALSLERLNDIRGGFDLPDGLRLGFSIDRALYVNGELAEEINVHIPDIAHITAEQAASFDLLNANTSLLQIGPGNQFDASGFPAGLMVIQNTLSDQQIMALTTITADVSTLGLFQLINSQDALQQALNRAATVR